MFCDALSTSSSSSNGKEQRFSSSCQRGSNSSEPETETEETDELQGDKISVTCGERENSTLWELDIVESCLIKLTVDTNSKSVTIKEVSVGDVWSELPGPGTYADTTTTIEVTDTTTSSTAVTASSSKSISYVAPRNSPSKTLFNPDLPPTAGDINLSNLNSRTVTFNSSRPSLLGRLYQRGSSNTAIQSESSSSGTEVGSATTVVEADGKLVLARTSRSTCNEAEHSLPGVLMTEKGWEVFELLYRLGRLENTR